MFSAQKLQVTLLFSDKCSGSVGPPLLNYSQQKVVWSQTSKFPDLFWFFTKCLQSAGFSWNRIFMKNPLALFRRNSIFCQQRCCRKYNRRTHGHSRIRAKMHRKRGNTFKYFCPWLLKLLKRIFVLLNDTLQNLYLQQSPEQESISGSCVRLEWSCTCKVSAPLNKIWAFISARDHSTKC